MTVADLRTSYRGPVDREDEVNVVVLETAEGFGARLLQKLLMLP